MRNEVTIKKETLHRINNALGRIEDHTKTISKELRKIGIREATKEFQKNKEVLQKVKRMIKNDDIPPKKLGEKWEINGRKITCFLWRCVDSEKRFFGVVNRCFFGNVLTVFDVF